MHLSKSPPAGGTVMTVKHQEGLILSETQTSSVTQQGVSSTTVASSTASSTSPPLQEQTVHSTVSSEQTEKDSVTVSEDIWLM